LEASNEAAHTYLTHFSKTSLEVLNSYKVTALLVFIQGDAARIEACAKAIANAAAKPLSVSQSALLAPLPSPARNIICVGKNYRAHAKEFGQSGFDAGAQGGDEIPEYPILFSKMPSSVTEPFADISLSADPLGETDYEGELGVIIGTGGRNISAGEAMDHVFGYTVLNDVTARGLQKRHKQWLLGKSPDGFCPMGPGILHASAVQDLGALRLETHVNGALRQSAPIADLIFDIPCLIETLSRSITLEPGDIIATGTPEGVGIGHTPPVFLKPGDRVRVSIDAIGAIESRFTA
ncbi:MAG: fumarylacetoacetate hydrolase family protein, partial [Pseudomonadota bacterium]